MTKAIIKNLVLTIGVFILMVISFSFLGMFIVAKVYAGNYTPLDFIDDCKRFEAKIGVDQNLGRYITFNYEY